MNDFLSYTFLRRAEKKEHAQAAATSGGVKKAAAKKGSTKKSPPEKQADTSSSGGPSGDGPAATSPASSAEGEPLPDESIIPWPEAMLKRVHPRRDREPSIAAPKLTVRTAYRNLHKAWPTDLRVKRFLPERFRDHVSSISEELRGGLSKETPVPEDPVRQGAALLALRLRLPLEYNAKRDPVSRHLVDYWVQGASLRFAVEAVCEMLSGDHDTQPLPAAKRNQVLEKAFRWGVGGFDRLRAYLAASEAAEHDAALEIAQEVFPRLGTEQKVILSYLFPAEEAWLEECLDVGVQSLVYEHFFLFSVATPAQLARIDAKRFLGNFVGEYRKADVLPTLAYSLGAELAPLLVEMLKALRDAPWREGRSIRDVAEVLALLPDDRAVAALLSGLEDKDVFEGLQEAQERFPVRVLRLLAGELSRRRGTIAQRAEMMAKSSLQRYPQALEKIEGEARERLAALLEDGAGEEAPMGALPDVLREPPWTRRPKLPKAKPIELERVSEPHRMDWAPGEQRRFARHRPLEEWYTEWITPRGFLKMEPEKAARGIRKLDPMYHTEVVHNLPRLVAAHELAMLPFILKLKAQPVPRAAASILPFDSVELAVPVAEWFSRIQNARPRARRWLLARAETAALGLLPAAVGTKGKERTAAIEALRVLAHNGHVAAIEKAIARYADQAPEADLRAALAPVLELDAIFVLPSKLPGLPVFADPHALPKPRLRDGRALPADAVETLLLMLAISSATDPYAGLAEVRQACDERSLAVFAEALFDAWLMSGADAKEKWAFLALGHLGGDAAARRLEPLLRKWPKEGAYPRAVLGLEVLGLIGSDMSLMLLHGIAQKASKGLQRAAEDAVERIAAERGLSPEQLADRLVPDLGLSKGGTLVLDYGPRSFTVSFDEELKPFVVDESGKKRKTAPKPGARDDAEKAGAAHDRWKELKKDARKVAKGQIERLERAMCEDRRWSRADFEKLLAGHPLLVHLVRRLLWGVYDGDGALEAAFRVDADGSYADSGDETFALESGVSVEAARIGLVHRLDLEDEAAERWREQWGDYELVSPFPQLDRDVYRPSEEERSAKKLKRFEGTEVSGGRVLGLERWGWRKGEVMAGGAYGWMVKPFGDGYHEVVLLFEPGILVGDPAGSEPQMLRHAVVWKAGSLTDRPAMPFGELPPKVFSEVVRDIEELRRPR